MQLQDQQGEQSIINIKQSSEFIQAKSFDEFITERIGLGRYQYIAYIQIGFILLADGAEALTFSIIMPALTHEWKLTLNDQSMLGSLYFVGVMLGALSGGFLGDYIGRKKVFTFSAIFTGFLGIISLIIRNFKLFIFIRVLFGFVIGFVSPLSVTIITEITPTKSRGQILILVRIMIMFGELYSLIVSYFSLNSSLTTGNWRIIILWSAIPAIISWLLSLKYLRESPRFELVNGRSENCFIILNEIGQINNKNFKELTPQEKQSLILYYAYNQKQKKNRSFQDEVEEQQFILRHFKKLFSKEYKIITILLWYIWFGMTFIFYGMNFVLPILISKLHLDTTSSTLTNTHHISFNTLIWPIIAEIPAAFLSSILIETEILGRKYLLMTSFYTSSVFLFLIVLFHQHFTLLVTITRFLLVTSFSVKYAYTSEVYPTEFRSTAVGIASSFGRFGGIFMPWICTQLFQYGDFMPYLGLATVAFIGGFFSLQLPYDTYERQLDTHLLDNSHENSSDSSF